MEGVIKRLPSPALVVAVAALVAALAGTAVAEQATISAKPVTKKKAKKIAKKEINKAAPGLSVASAASATSAGALDEVEFVRSSRVTVAAGTDGGAIANCPEGKVATGGGGLFPGLSGVNFQRSYPSNGNANQAGYTAWEFQIRNQGAQPRFIRAYVICVDAESTPSNYSPGVNPVN